MLVRKRKTFKFSSLIQEKRNMIKCKIYTLERKLQSYANNTHNSIHATHQARTQAFGANGRKTILTR